MDTRTTGSSLPTEPRGILLFAWILAIHVTALVGLVMYPRPGWRLLLGSTMLVFLGGQGATICYHASLLLSVRRLCSRRLHERREAPRRLHVQDSGQGPTDSGLSERLSRSAADVESGASPRLSDTQNSSAGRPA